jgi:predicted nuclease of predicted toxin-antitoxin system
MRFLIDEDLPRSTDSLLRQHGHEAIDIRDTGLRGASDADIAAYAQKHGLCLLSGDVGFADIRNYPPEKYSGVVVLHLPAKATSSTILTLLQSLLAQTEIVNQLKGKLAVIERGRVRIRKG